MYNTAFQQQSLKDFSFLVTGGAGFIGSNLVEYLVKYNAKKVRILDNFSTGQMENILPFLKNSQENPNNIANNTIVELLEGDIRDLETCHKACKDMDFVLHQAALGSVPRSIDNPIATNEANITGFLNMLVAAKDAHIKRFVYAASSSTYGDSQKLPKKEDEIGKPLSPYALTKYVNELYADVFNRTYGLNTIGLRYFNIFGPRQSPKGAYAAVIPLFAEALLTNTSPKINGDGSQTRDFTFVENAVQANIKAVFAEKTDTVNQIYNVACGERISVNDLFETLREYAQTDLKAIYQESRKGDVQNSLADISKINTLLGYDNPIKSREGLKITWEWFKDRF